MENRFDKNTHRLALAGQLCGATLLLTLISIPGVLVAGVLIYLFNRYVSFRRCELDVKDVKALALSLAIATAPYTMLIPVVF